MTTVVRIPCQCELDLALNPGREGVPCACRGPETLTIDGQRCVVAYVTDGSRSGEPPELPLAELCARRPDDMTLPQWIAAIGAQARALIDAERGR